VKHVQSFKEFLIEGIMPPSNTYPFKDEDEEYVEDDGSLLSVNYIFETPKNKYRVTFYSGEYPASAKKFDLSFGLDKGSFNKLDTFQMTGEGNVRSILKTIAVIVEEFLYEYDWAAKHVVIDATDEKRRRLYKELIPQYLSTSALRKVTIK
jgi:hypothetical protein